MNWILARLEAQSRVRQRKAGMQAYRPIRTELPLWCRLHDRAWPGGSIVTDRLMRERLDRFATKRGDA